MRGRVKEESGSADSLSELVSSESLLDLGTRILNELEDFEAVEGTKAHREMRMHLFGYQMTARTG
jgi:hypothetical protein